MRSYKIKKFINLENIVENFIFIKYEDLKENPNFFLQNIKTTFGIQTLPFFKDVTTYRGFMTNIAYLPHIYDYIQKSDFPFVYSNLDLDLEHLIGYSF
jgi:hypothetical protein